MAAYVSMGEAHRRITDYLNRFYDAVSYQDGPSLKLLLSLSSNSSSLLSLADALNVYQDANRLIKQSDKYSQLGEIIGPLFRALHNYRLGNLIDSYQAFEKSAKLFLPLFFSMISILCICINVYVQFGNGGILQCFYSGVSKLGFGLGFGSLVCCCL